MPTDVFLCCDSESVSHFLATSSINSAEDLASPLAFSNVIPIEPNADVALWLVVIRA